MSVSVVKSLMFIKLYKFSGKEVKQTFYTSYSPDYGEELDGVENDILGFFDKGYNFIKFKL